MEGNTAKYSSIGWAVGLMLNGHQMRRRGWNNRIDWVAFVPKGSVAIPHKFAEGNDTGPFLVVKRRHGPIVPWTVTQQDLLADDWEMVNELKPGHYSDKAITADNPDGRVAP